MTHGSLYSGIGGWLLAARRAGIENIFTVEIDEFCNKVLNKHFNVEQHRDIKEFDGIPYAGRIDILSTSDPCQPFSFAGKRSGKADDRYLWPQTIRVIREIKPSYVVFENVPGFISLGFETVAYDLEAEGYAVESFVIPACAVGAWHRRDRLWVVAYDDKWTWSNRSSKGERENTGGGAQGKNRGLHGSFPNPTEQRLARENIAERSVRSDKGDTGFDGRIWETEPELDRVVPRISRRVDRLKSLGNAIVPQIAYIIFEAIKQVEKTKQKTTTAGVPTADD